MNMHLKRTDLSTNKALLSLTAMLAMMTAWPGSAVQAAVSDTYDADLVTTGPQDGSGAGWNISSNPSDWWNSGSSADEAWPNLNTSAAIFGAGSGAAGTVTVGTVNANAITFNTTGSGNYTLSGGTITLTGTTPTITANVSATISSVIAGTAGLSTFGGGTLTLNGANTYTGGTTVNAGTLVVMAPSDANWAVSSASTILSGATQRFDFSNQTTQYRNTSLNAITLNPNSTLELYGTNNNANDFYVINSWTPSGSGTIRVVNGATAIGTGSANWSSGFTGTIDIQGGQLSFNLQTGFTLPGTFTVNVGGSGKLDIRTGNPTIGALTGSGSVIKSYTGETDTFTVGNGDASGSFSGILSGSNYKLVKAGNGTQILSGANTYSGGTSLAAGTLQLGVANALPSSGTVAFNGGTLNSNGLADTLGPLSITSGTSTLQFGASPDTGNVLKFASATATSGTLQVTNWDGKLTGGGNDQFFVTANPSAVLGSISFINPNESGTPVAGTFGATSVAVAGGFEIVPIPEPTTFAAVGLGAIGFLARRRRVASHRR